MTQLNVRQDEIELGYHRLLVARLDPYLLGY